MFLLFLRCQMNCIHADLNACAIETADEVSAIERSIRTNGFRSFNWNKYDYSFCFYCCCSLYERTTSKITHKKTTKNNDIFKRIQLLQHFFFFEYLIVPCWCIVVQWPHLFWLLFNVHVIICVKQMFFPRESTISSSIFHIF